MTGAVLPPLTVTLTRAALVRYAGASTDFNPIHYSERHAAALGLPGVVAHGLLTMGVALRAVTDWAGDPGRILAYSARFARPIVVPDTDAGVAVKVTGFVAEETPDTQTVHLEVVAAGQPVLTKATVTVRR